MAWTTRQLGEDHPETLLEMHKLGEAYLGLGRCNDAAELLEETLAARKRVLGEDHLDTLLSMSNLGVTYRELGRREHSTGWVLHISI